MSITNPAAQSAAAPFDLTWTNDRFAHAPPDEILEFIRDAAVHPVISTNFRPLSIALVHLVNTVMPGVPVLWIDHGYNTAETLAFVSEVTTALDLNLQVYRPRIGDIAPGTMRVPALETPEHVRFTERVKLEPFARALTEWRPDYWITGIRAEQTEYRRSLDVFSAGPQGAIRVAPFYRWTEVDVEGYIYDQALPDYTNYVDPTKGVSERECGLQQLA
ncbi:MAG: phosphoadenosine phosphosulfate reductase domain-containing protein [Gammaproteobacteria bacterium]|jgi:phosphoadenosine phosphosulfate reductase